MITVTLTFQSAAEAAVFLAGRSDPAVMTFPTIDHGRSMSAVDTAESFTAQAGRVTVPPGKPVESSAVSAQSESATGAASAQQSSAGSTTDSNKAVAQLGATPDYKEIVRCVNALAKKGGNPLALKVLGLFKTVSGDQVNHGNKLQLTDYVAFIETAEGALS